MAKQDEKNKSKNRNSKNTITRTKINKQTDTQLNKQKMHKFSNAVQTSTQQTITTLSSTTRDHIQI